MVRRFDFFRGPAALFCLFFLTAAAVPSPGEKREETIESGQSAEALKMIQERFEALSGGLRSMPEPPRIQGEINIPVAPERTVRKPQTAESEGEGTHE